MKKEDFIKLGLDEDIAKKCAAASEEELKIYVPKADFDILSNEKTKLELDVRDRDGQLETLKKSTDNPETLKQTIATLQAENTAKDEKHAAEMKKIKRDSVDRELLSTAKAKNIQAVLGVLNSLDVIDDKLDIDTYRAKRKEQIESLTKTDDSKFLFDAQANKPKMKGATPGSSGGDTPGSEVDTSDMSYDELCTFLEQNPDATLE